MRDPPFDALVTPSGYQADISLLLAANPDWSLTRVTPKISLSLAGKVGSLTTAA
jgi:hypothetical protein